MESARLISKLFGRIGSGRGGDELIEGSWLNGRRSRLECLECEATEVAAEVCDINEACEAVFLCFGGGGALSDGTFGNGLRDALAL